MPGFDFILAELTEDPLSVNRATAAVEGDDAGAVVSFSGVVRNHDSGKAVNRLSYSAHPPHTRSWPNLWKNWSRSTPGRGNARPHLGRPPRRAAQRR